MERAYRYSTRALSLLLVIVGLASVAMTLARGAGVLTIGVVVGLTLAGLGLGRLLLAARAGGGRPHA